MVMTVEITKTRMAEMVVEDTGNKEELKDVIKDVLESPLRTTIRMINSNLEEAEAIVEIETITGKVVVGSREEETNVSKAKAKVNTEEVDEMIGETIMLEAIINTVVKDDRTTTAEDEMTAETIMEAEETIDEMNTTEAEMIDVTIMVEATHTVINKKEEITVVGVMIDEMIMAAAAHHRTQVASITTRKSLLVVSRTVC